jgi:P27 family predicted phage terminase small subunit
MRGRKPLPTALKIVTGNPGKRRLNTREPIPEGKLTDAPDWMSDTQKESWKYAIEHAPAGVLKKIDCSALAVWVVAEDLHRQAIQKVTKLGMLVKAPKTEQPIQSPYLPIVNKQAFLMLKAGAELGFTPSSRSRIVGEPEVTPNKWAGL